MTVQSKPLDDPSSFNTAIREDIVQTAVKFLENPKVANTPLAQKQTFLQRKGLTDHEIQVACERSGSYLLHNDQTLLTPPPPPNRYTSIPIPGNYGQIQQISIFQRIREVVHSAALFSIVIYAVYAFYKKFIRPFLFGQTKKKSVEDNIEELKENVSSVKEELEKLQRGTECSTNRHLQTLQTEIATVKGLLLSRKQFPTVPNSPVVPQSIPAWQMTSVPQDSDAKSEDLMEIASGSSDQEQGTKNSDSSLEIM